MTNTDKERDDFEAWARNGFELHRHGGAEYSSSITQCAWAAWQARAGCEAERAEAVTDAERRRELLAAEDRRQEKLHELLETIREQIRLEVAPEHRPDTLMKNIQDAVYAMRGRTPLLNDAALVEPQAVTDAEPFAWWAETGTAGAGDDCNKLFFMRELAVDHVRKHGGHVIAVYRGVPLDIEAENNQLRGTLEYIKSQSKNDYPGVLSVIRANASAALDRSWQKTVSCALAALIKPEGK